MSRNVFFIDDSESMQKAVSTIFLDNLDFNLNSVHDPSSLMETANDFSPDIIILSYNSINTEIKQNISEIKNSESLSKVPLILLVPSDLSDNERELFIKQGISGFIYRPFEKDIFLSKIKRALGITDERDRIIADTEKTDKNIVLPEEPAPKIYDISSFETNDEGKDDIGIQKITDDTGSPEPPATKSTINMDVDNDVNNTENNSSHDNSENINSAELSQAFENLFKDDAIFKEFQDINEDKDSTLKINKSEIKEGFDLDGTIQEDIPAVQPIVSESEPAKTISEDLTPTPIEITKTTDGQDKEEFEIGQITPVQDIKESALPADNNPIILEESKNIEDKEKDETLTKGGFKLEILDEQNLVKLDESLKNSIQKIMEEIKPEIVDNIKGMLPDIVEKLIKEEIEKIKSAAVVS